MLGSSSWSNTVFRTVFGTSVRYILARMTPSTPSPESSSTADRALPAAAAPRRSPGSRPGRATPALTAEAHRRSRRSPCSTSRAWPGSRCAGWPSELGSRGRVALRPRLGQGGALGARVRRAGRPGPAAASPDPAHWREQVYEMLWRPARRRWSAHRDAALAGLGRMPTSPKTLAAAEVLVAIAARRGDLATGRSRSASTS